jgi:hypothetical protein
MRKNLILITDSREQSFLMRIWTPSVWTKVSTFNTRGVHGGDWEAVDYGWIKYVEGDAWRHWPSDASGADLFFFQSGGRDDDAPKGKRGWGMKLLRYDDNWGTNDMGLGEIVQPWCAAIEPGKITWNKLTERDLYKRTAQIATGHSTNAPMQHTPAP